MHQKRNVYKGGIKYIDRKTYTVYTYYKYLLCTETRSWEKPMSCISLYEELW